MEESAPSNSKKYILIGIFSVLFVNIVILDVLFALSKSSPENVNPIQSVSTECSGSCIDKLSKKIISQNALMGSPSATEDSSSKEAEVSKATPTPTSAVSSSHEYFIPLGTGSGMGSDWTVVSGIGAKVDPGNYEKIDKVYFEATIRVPQGNQEVHVRLYNATTYQGIINSDLSLSSGETTSLLISQPITLSSKESLYQVQIKTQQQLAAYIDQARIHIITK